MSNKFDGTKNRCMKIYCIPGLGFDNRIFSKLNLQNYDVDYINWIEPTYQESWNSYAKRMAEVIDDSQKCVLIGHSLGGILSQEIASFKQIDKIILISSIQSRVELPFHFKIIQPLRLHYFFIKQFTFATFPLWAKQQDYKTKEAQALFKSMVGKQSNQYLRWALGQLSIWQSPKIPNATQVFQIHGSLDKTFPIMLIQSADKVISNGGHFMIYNFSKILENFIIQVLKI